MPSVETPTLPPALAEVVALTLAVEAHFPCQTGYTTDAAARLALWYIGIYGLKHDQVAAESQS